MLRLLQRALLGDVLGVQGGDLLLLWTVEEEVPEDADHHGHDADDDVELTTAKLHHCPPPIVIDGAAGASGGVVAKGRRLAEMVNDVGRESAARATVPTSELDVHELRHEAELGEQRGHLVVRRRTACCRSRRRSW